MHAYGHDERAQMRSNRAGTTAPVQAYNNPAAHESEYHGMVTGVPVQGVQGSDWQPNNCVPPIVSGTSDVPWCTTVVTSSDFAPG